jgi:hypothetical protein
MTIQKSVSKQTRDNWIIDAGLFLSAVMAILSGAYFLYLPVGGYQGGRNPTYGIQIIFERSTWDDIHTWTGILMISIAALHIVLHWKWIQSMTLRIVKTLFNTDNRLNFRSWINALVNAVAGFSFLAAALSGVYFLWFPGGRYGVADPLILFQRSTWDLVHTWSGIMLVFAALAHLVIHWRWIIKVTNKILKMPVSNNKQIVNTQS